MFQIFEIPIQSNNIQFNENLANSNVSKASQDTKQNNKKPPISKKLPEPQKIVDPKDFLRKGGRDNSNPRLSPKNFENLPPKDNNVLKKPIMNTKRPLSPTTTVCTRDTDLDVHEFLKVIHLKYFYIM